ncbi:hypothetical protein KCU88_g7103, partial [Aureobasidium melanogenum]
LDELDSAVDGLEPVPEPDPDPDPGPGPDVEPEPDTEPELEPPPEREELGRLLLPLPLSVAVGTTEMIVPPEVESVTAVPDCPAWLAMTVPANEAEPAVPVEDA